ncbi:hypothetical protein [Micromonospora cathayae]|uniref:HEAT repeat-containing protein n=1 Tax=Micromonospora cathayae TaxID=3028804 RepID=A0ABY7ZLX7_9ACTN|nr:hypothetical protein [Micromonospora sp. HUAS 3]WDZ83965.1 hypothetical protein PVK37_26415 [Micromonospora sp. HUAS 3]
MGIDPDWSRIGCAGGLSEHIPILLAQLVSKDAVVRERAFMTLVHDLAWNENAYEATPYAICRIVHDLRSIETPDPALLLTLLRRLGNAEAASPDYIQWRGEPTNLIVLCRQLLEAHLDLYVRFLDDSKSKTGALDVITSFRLNSQSAEKALKDAMGRETSSEGRAQFVEAINDLREWNQATEAVDAPSLPEGYLEKRLELRRDQTAFLANPDRRKIAAPGELSYFALRSRLLGVVIRALRRASS